MRSEEKAVYIYSFVFITDKLFCIVEICPCWMSYVYIHCWTIVTFADNCNYQFSI